MTNLSNFSTKMLRDELTNSRAREQELRAEVERLRFAQEVAVHRLSLALETGTINSYKYQCTRAQEVLEVRCAD